VCRFSTGFASYVFAHRNAVSPHEKSHYESPVQIINIMLIRRSSFEASVTFLRP